MPELLDEPLTSELFPLKLRDGLEIKNATEIASLIVAATDAQVVAKQLQSAESRNDYQFACDSLNANRMVLRLQEEGVEPAQSITITATVVDGICTKRGYEVDEFEAGMEATRERARFPFGLRPLTMARERALKKPIHLRVAGLENSKAAALIGGLAFHLQEIVGDGPIMLPVEDVRKLFRLRKLVVSGTIRLLVKAGVLDCTNPVYFTGRARHFRFVGLRGRHFDSADIPNLDREDIPF